MADFGGFPSSVIEGTYRENDMTLNTSRRHLIAQSGADRYLVSLSVTTAANQVVATAAATDGIVNGFRVTSRRRRSPRPPQRPPQPPPLPPPAAPAAAPAAARLRPRQPLPRLAAHGGCGRAPARRYRRLSRRPPRRRPAAAVPAQ